MSRSCYHRFLNQVFHHKFITCLLICNPSNQHLCISFRSLPSHYGLRYISARSRNSKWRFSKISDHSKCINTKNISISNIRNGKKHSISSFYFWKCSFLSEIRKASFFLHKDLTFCKEWLTDTGKKAFLKRIYENL